MSVLLVWAGPVYAPHASPYSNGDIGNVDWIGEDVRVVTYSFNGSTGAGIYSSLLDSSGRALPAIAAKSGMPLDAYSKVAVAGYSAGHNFLNPLLQSDGDRIDACVSIDACYSATNPPWTKAGYVSFGEKAARGEALMVLAATGSSHGGAGYPSSSGSECAIANFDAAASGAGVGAQVIDSGLVVPPTTSERAGNLILLDYGLQQFKDLPNPGQIPHWHIINNLSRDIFQTYLAPYLAASSLPGDPPASSSDGAPVVVAGLTAIALLALYLRSRRS